MTVSTIELPMQACVFVLGCAILHCARAHAAAVTHRLAATAILIAALVLFGASLMCAPNDEMNLENITVYNAA